MFVKINTQMPVGQQIGNAIIGQERTQEPIGQQIRDAIIGKERTQEPIGQQIGDIIKGETPYETTATEIIKNTILSEEGNEVENPYKIEYDPKEDRFKPIETVTVDGKHYKVQKEVVYTKNPKMHTLLPMKEEKEFIIVDGKKYEVKEVEEKKNFLSFKKVTKKVIKLDQKNKDNSKFW